VLLVCGRSRLRVSAAQQRWLAQKVHEPERNARQQRAGAPRLRTALVVEQQRCGRAGGELSARSPARARRHDDVRRWRARTV
jgi:hypothetical protein